MSEQAENEKPEKFKPPAFQFYPKDWLDYRVLRMSLPAQALYIRLLCFMWKDSPDHCSILNDDKSIANTLGVPIIKWKQTRGEFFPETDPILEIRGNRLVSKRLEEEFRKQKEYRETRKANGSQGGRPPKTERKPYGFENETIPKAKANLKETSSSAFPTTEEINKDHFQTDRRSLPSSPPSPQATESVPVSVEKSVENFDQKFSAVCKFWEEAFAGAPDSYGLRILCQQYDEDVLKNAITIAAEKRKPFVNFVRGVALRVNDEKKVSGGQLVSQREGVWDPDAWAEKS